MPRLRLKLSDCFVLGALLSRYATGFAQAPKPEAIEFFEKRIRPVLAERCYKCHSADAEKVKGDLLLDNRDAMLKGGESGKPAVVAGDAEKSRLIEAIRYGNDDLQMPPKKAGGKLSDEQIADFVTWVDMGAPDPRAAKSEIRNPKSEINKFWAFQPPKEP